MDRADLKSFFWEINDFESDGFAIKIILLKFLEVRAEKTTQVFSVFQKLLSEVETLSIQIFHCDSSY